MDPNAIGSIWRAFPCLCDEARSGGGTEVTKPP